jgi:hypothetical protein
MSELVEAIGFAAAMVTWVASPGDLIWGGARSLTVADRKQQMIASSYTDQL